MTQKSINLGTADQGNGDPLRVAFGKVNDNFTELYTALGLVDNTLNLGAFEFTGSVISTTDSSAIVIDQAVTVSSNLTVGGDVLPTVANGGDLGSSTLPWRSLYVSNNTIYIGGTAVGLDANGNLTVNGSQVTGGSVSSLVNGAHQLELIVNGTTPYVTFPSHLDEYVYIQGGEINVVGHAGLLSTNNEVFLMANADGLQKMWTFGTDGTLTVPPPAPITFTATLSPIYHDGGGDARSVTVTFMPYANGTVEVIIGGFGGMSVNPGYQSGDAWTYTEADHGIPGYTFTLSIIDIGYNNTPMTPFWEPTFGASGGPSYIQTIKPTIKSTSAIKLSADTKNWTFGTDGVLTLPTGGDIVDSTGTTVLGGGTADTGSWTFDTVTATTDGNIIVKAGSGEAAWASLLSNNGANSFWVDDVGAHVTSNFVEGEVTENYWTFGTDGDLTLPGGRTRIGTLLGTDAIIANEDTAFGVVAQGTNGAVQLVWIEDSENFGTSNLAAVYVNSGGPGSVRIATGANGDPGPKFWEFNNSGALTFPQGTTIATADGTDAFIIDGAVDKDVQIYTYSGETARGWTFGTDGSLTLPEGSYINETTPIQGFVRTKYAGSSNGDVNYFTTATLIETSIITTFIESYDDSLVGGADYSFQYVGYFKAPVTGLYTFTLYGDDYAKCWIGDNAIAGYTSGNSSIYTGYNSNNFNTIELTANNFYPIRIQCWNSSGPGYFSFSWAGPDGGPDNNFTGVIYTAIGQTEITAISRPIVLNTNNIDTDYQWTFGTDGKLTFPDGSYIDETAAPLGTAKSLDLHPGNPGYPNQYLKIYPTVSADADHLHLTSGDLTATELFLGDDEQYVKLTNTGNVEIRTGAFDYYNTTKGVWTFDSNGALTLPTHNATPGSRIKSAVDITIETGPYYLVDLVAVGSGSVTDGIGTLDFLISSAPDWATAVAVGDHVVSGTWTDIIIAVEPAGDVNRWTVTFASGEFTGNDNKWSFYKPGAAGGTWTFGTDGQLTVPGDITTPIIPQVGIIVYNLPDYNSSFGDGVTYVWVQAGPGAAAVYELISTIGDMTGCIFTNELGVEYTVIQDLNPDGAGGLTLEFDSEIPPGHTYTVRSPNYVAKIVPALNVKVDENEWTFGTDGSLTIPGDIRSNGNINIEINIGDSTLRRWQFGEDGALTFPDGTNQTTAYTGGGSTSYTPDDTDNWNDPTVNTIQAALDELAARVTALQNYEIDGGNAYTPALGELLIDGNGA